MYQAKKEKKNFFSIMNLSTCTSLSPHSLIFQFGSKFLNFFGTRFERRRLVQSPKETRTGENFANWRQCPRSCSYFDIKTCCFLYVVHLVSNSLEFCFSNSPNFIFCFRLTWGMRWSRTKHGRDVEFVNDFHVILGKKNETENVVMADTRLTNGRSFRIF